MSALKHIGYSATFEDLLISCIQDPLYAMDHAQIAYISQHLDSHQELLEFSCLVLTQHSVIFRGVLATVHAEALALSIEAPIS